MTRKIESVRALPGLFVEAKFISGEIKKYDMKQLFEVFPQFCVFESDEKLFQKVQVDVGGYGISWNDELDLNADTIWEDGILVDKVQQTDINRLLAYQILLARESAHMTQKQLAEKTGIYQADISKIERGIGNPSLSTLKRIAAGLDMTLEITLKAV